MTNDKPNAAAQIGEDLRPAWDSLAAAFGPAADQGATWLSLASGRGSADIAHPSAVAEALAEGCQKAWAIVAGILAETTPLSGALDPLVGQRQRLAPRIAAKQCASFILFVIRAGMFQAAATGLSKAWQAAPHAGLWLPSEALAMATSGAIQGPAPGWAEPLPLDAKLGLLLALPCWPRAADGLDEPPSSDRRWTAALADLGRLAASKPALSAQCSALTKLAEPLWLPWCGDVESFGMELGQELGRRKIVGGALCPSYWSALPFEARMGLALGVKASSKLGSWSISRLVGDARAADDASGPRRRELEDACAAIWSGFDRGAIDLLEALTPPEREGWIFRGVSRRFSAASGGSGIMQWHNIEESWGSSRAQWARKLAASAGLAAPAPDPARPRSCMELIQALQALRQAEAIRKSLPPTDKASKASPRPQRPRI